MARELGPGAKAPVFTLPRDGGGTISLADFAGRKLVLYFYPRADTPGCTKEAIDFSGLKPAFGKAETDVLGVSADPVPAQDKFKSKHKLSIALASDETHRMLEAYGVWQEKSMYGRKFLGVVRATFLIGPDQRIARSGRRSRWQAMQKRCWPQPKRSENLPLPNFGREISRRRAELPKHLQKAVKCPRRFAEN
jgi:peroxiredoxin Q/BCP